MFDDIKQLAKHSVVYGVGNLASKIIGFLMIPVYTRYLLPSDYGVVELLSMTVDIISILIGMGVGAAIFRFYYDYNEIKERNALVSTALLFVGIITLLVVLACTMFTDKFSQIVFKTDKYSYYFLIMFITLFFRNIIEYCFAYIQVKQRSLTYTVLSLFQLAVGLALNIYFIAILKKGVLGVLYSSLITAVLIGLFLIFKTFIEINIRFSYSKLKRMINFGMPLVLSGLCTFILTFSDRYFLNHFSTLSQVGLYSLSYKFGIMISFLITAPFINIWTPKLYEIAKREEAQKTFSKTYTYFTFVIVMAGLGLSVLIKDILRVVSAPEYHEAYKLVPLIVLAYIFIGSYYHFNIGIYLKNKTKYIAIIWVALAVINLILNYALIKLLHAFGAALSTVLSYFFLTLIAYVISNKLYPIPYEFKRIAKMFLVAPILYWGSLLIHQESPFYSLFLKGFFIAAFPLILFFIRFFEPIEKDFFRRVLELSFSRFKKLVAYNF